MRLLNAFPYHFYRVVMNYMYLCSWNSLCIFLWVGMDRDQKKNFYNRNKQNSSIVIPIADQCKISLVRLHIKG